MWLNLYGCQAVHYLEGHLTTKKAFLVFLAQNWAYIGQPDKFFELDILEGFFLLHSHWNQWQIMGFNECNSIFIKPNMKPLFNPG